MKTVKLSQVTLEELHENMPIVYMQDSANDVQHSITTQRDLDYVRTNLMRYYGDVNIIVGGYKVIIDDEKFKSDFNEFCRIKGEWCKRFGAN